MSIPREDYIRATVYLMKQLCEPYGYRVNRVVDRIHIRTKCEEWYFVPKQGGKIKLMHKNARIYSPRADEYHVQFKKYISYSDIVNYVHNHEVHKYGVKKVMKKSEVSE